MTDATSTIWACSNCGLNPRNTSQWCDSGCGRDYQDMIKVKAAPGLALCHEGEAVISGKVVKLQLVPFHVEHHGHRWNQSGFCDHCRVAVQRVDVCDATPCSKNVKPLYRMVKEES